MFDGARVVALGEATHGSREFFQLKHRLVRFLIEDHDFRTFAMEAHFTRALAVNDYVLDVKGDAKSRKRRRWSCSSNGFGCTTPPSMRRVE